MAGKKAVLDSKWAIQYTQAKVCSSERVYKVMAGKKAVLDTVYTGQGMVNGLPMISYEEPVIYRVFQN